MYVSFTLNWSYFLKKLEVVENFKKHGEPNSVTAKFPISTQVKQKLILKKLKLKANTSKILCLTSEYIFLF